jgi:hypothetical protein
MSDLESTTGKVIATAAKKLSPITYLSSKVRTMPRSDVDELAIAYLLGQVTVRKRTEAREIEQSADRERKIQQDARHLKNFGPKRNTEAWHNWLETADGAKTKAREIEYERQDRERSRALWSGIQATMDKYKSEMHMEWNRELLASEFALGDGTKTTWGDATYADHEYRVSMHMKNAAAGVEGAARHRSALDFMDERGAATLNQALLTGATQTVTT